MRTHTHVHTYTDWYVTNYIQLIQRKVIVGLYNINTFWTIMTVLGHRKIWSVDQWNVDQWLRLWRPSLIHLFNHESPKCQRVNLKPCPRAILKINAIRVVVSICAIGIINAPWVQHIWYQFHSKVPIKTSAEAPHISSDSTIILLS